MESDARVAPTPELLRIVASARHRDLNRQLAPDALPLLREEGTHVLQPLMIHAWAGGRPAVPHMRVMGYLALTTNPETTPEQVILDVPMNLWLRLKTVEEVQA